MAKLQAKYPLYQVFSVFRYLMRMLWRVFSLLDAFECVLMWITPTKRPTVQLPVKQIPWTNQRSVYIRDLVKTPQTQQSQNDGMPLKTISWSGVCDPVYEMASSKGGKDKQMNEHTVEVSIAVWLSVEACLNMPSWLSNCQLGSCQNLFEQVSSSQVWYALGPNRVCSKELCMSFKLFPSPDVQSVHQSWS